MKILSVRGSIFPALALVSALPAFAAGVSYTCDSTVGSIDGSGVCGYLNSNIAGLYNSTFTNANASIYITTSSSGLGGSAQVTQFVTYSTYYGALSGESTDTTALASLPSSEPSIFGSSDVGISAALAQGLGIAGSSTVYGALYGVTPGVGGTDPSLSACVLGTLDCYNGVIEIVTPSGLSSETSGTQGLWFRDVTGTASGSQPGNDYDYFTVVEHETDELLGTTSCTSVASGPTANNTCSNGGNGPSANDLFRYSAPGTRVFNSLTSAYFSPDGGVTDTEGNTFNTTKVGEDYADFHQGCVFVQDAEGCPGQSVDITNDYLGGQGPEIPMLNAVGYDLTSPTPEPGTLGTLAFGFTTLGVFAYRRRCNRS